MKRNSKIQSITPEQQAEQAKQQAERVAVVATEKVLRREANRQKLKEAHEDLRVQATEWAKSNDDVKSNIGAEWIKLDDHLRDWLDEFMARPVDRFEWASSIMVNAAKRKTLDDILYASRRLDSDLLKVLVWVRDDITANLVMNRWRSNSTSQVHNAQQQANAEAGSNYIGSFGMIGYWIKQLQKRHEGRVAA